MVTKDADAKPLPTRRPNAPTTSQSATTSGATGLRAGASPSRLRPSAGASTTAHKAAVPSTKPAAAVVAKSAPPIAKAATSAKPASVASRPTAGAGTMSKSTPATNKAAAKPAAAKAATGGAAKGAQAGKGAQATKGAQTGKGAAVRSKPANAAAAPDTAAAPPPEPGPDHAEEAARRAQLEVKAAAEMEALRRAAWQVQVEYERRQEAKWRQQREEEARRRKEEAALRKALLEAAFDDDVSALRSGLRRAQEAGLLAPLPCEAADAHGNTLLSEAAAGGALGAVQLLLQLGADPNTRGEFLRTPLWRAAFLGKEEVVLPLLEGGADPRIGNEGGELPEHVAPPAVQEVLRGWDVARTEQLLGQLQGRQEERAAAAAAERAQAVHGAEQSVTEAAAAAERAQRALSHARMELEKRIHEYDTCVGEDKPEGLTQVALDQVHMAEKIVEEARKQAAEAAEALDAARLQLRKEQLQQHQAGDGGEEAEALPGVPVTVKALNDVLIRDVGGLIAASGKWPLVIDTSGQASVFLRYQDTNYVNALNSRHMEPHMLRRALLGAVRYGKALVLDLQDCDLWPEMPRLFDQVQPGLLSQVLDKSLLQGDRYAALIRTEDGDEYDKNKFQEARIRNFSFVVLTAARQPNPLLVQQLYALRLTISG